MGLRLQVFQKVQELIHLQNYSGCQLILALYAWHMHMLFHEGWKKMNRFFIGQLFGQRQAISIICCRCLLLFIPLIWSPLLEQDMAGELVKRIRLSISRLSCVMIGDLEVKSNRRHSHPLAPLALGWPLPQPPPSVPRSHTTSHTQAPSQQPFNT